MVALWLLRSQEPQGLHRERLQPGVPAISNADRTAPWPKVAYPEQALRQLSTQETVDAADLLETLAARAPVPTAEVPMADLPRVTSTPFIADLVYGSRSSTVLLITHTGRATLVERSFDHRGDRQGDVTVEFAIGQA